MTGVTYVVEVTDPKGKVHPVIPLEAAGMSVGEFSETLER